MLLYLVSNQVSQILDAKRKRSRRDGLEGAYASPHQKREAHHHRLLTAHLITSAGPHKPAAVGHQIREPRRPKLTLSARFALDYKLCSYVMKTQIDYHLQAPDVNDPKLVMPLLSIPIRRMVYFYHCKLAQFWSSTSKSMGS